MSKNSAQIDTIGLVITTFNSESYFQTLYNSIPFDRVGHVVVVNGGEPYKEKYDYVHWIQHDTVKYPCVARNDGIKYLWDKNIDHFFVCEDDMIIKDPNIFDAYIQASQFSGLQYFIYASISWESGPKHYRTPAMSVQYSEYADQVNFFRNMCNEFTYNSRKLINDVGLYDENMKNLFDSEYAYRVSQLEYGNPFWYFPDIYNSDSYIDNNPDAKSRLDHDGQRMMRLKPDHDYFKTKHRTDVSSIPLISTNQVIDKLKVIKPI
jgi:hypothetical protein